MLCPGCERDFPEGLIHTLESGARGGVWETRLCPLCALSWVNRFAGLPPGTPFRAPNARHYYAQAVAHLQATGQLDPEVIGD